MKRLDVIIGVTLLVSSVVFNLFLYRAEPTVQVDPNDNAFQFALVDRTNEIWDYADRTCPKNVLRVTCHVSLLIDHWVPNWAEGYNLPTYYSHIPQILVVGSYKVISSVINFSLFSYYHVIIYLLLCLFPLSIFLALKILKNSWLTAGMGAVLATLISTDGLYGLDPSSYLWRGWGLSSQLFGAIFLPIAIAYMIRACDAASRKKYYVLSILFLTLTTAGHLGIGLMGFLSLPVIAFSPLFLSILHTDHVKVIWSNALVGLGNIIKIALPPLILLSYWIVPTVLLGNFHNMSFWDPIWKFNSYGAREVLVNFFNGNLFDFERFPVITLLVCTGLLAGLVSKKNEGDRFSPFLFLFFLLLYFGKTTWGDLINLIPSMNEFHQHRFIVGVHLAGLMLATIGLTWFMTSMSSAIQMRIRKKNAVVVFPIISTITLTLVITILLPRTLSYGTYNETLIQASNTAFSSSGNDARLLIETLRGLPRGRVFAGRGGSWGKDFKIGGEKVYMYLSTYGIPTILWMPETWSPSTDMEQSFIEHDPSHYDLYDVKYVVTPPKMPEGSDVQPFWKLMKETSSWRLYTVDVSGTVVAGAAPSIVYSDKYSYKNIVRLWIQEPGNTKYIFPELRLDRPDKTNIDLPWFNLVDPVTYQTPDGKMHSIFTEPPKYMTPWEWPASFPQYFHPELAEGQSSIPTQKTKTSIETLPISIVSQSSDTDMVFRATVKIEKECPTCVIILKHTYAPGWNVMVNGKSVKHIIVFPFYTAVRLEEAGTYDIVFTYTPSRVKMTLIFLPPLLLGLWFIIRNARKN